MVRMHVVLIIANTNKKKSTVYKGYGAILCLLKVAKEIIIGLFKGRDSKSYGNDNDNNNNNPNNLDLACEYKDRMTSCGSTENTLRRIINMMRNSGRFRFQN